MTGEDLEFLISQYVDGTLSAEDRATVETHLAESPDARLLVHEYRKLDTLLKSAPPVPAIDYGALSSRINDAIDEHNAAPSHRIGFNFNWRWASIGAGLAVAASVAIAVGLWLRPAGTTTAPQQQLAETTAKPTAIVQVALVPPDEARPANAGPVVGHVQIGPPPGQPAGYSVISEALVSRPNTLFIAKADEPAQDTSQPLY